MRAAGFVVFWTLLLLLVLLAVLLLLLLLLLGVFEDRALVGVLAGDRGLAFVVGADTLLRRGVRFRVGCTRHRGGGEAREGKEEHVFVYAYTCACVIHKKSKGDITVRKQRIQSKWKGENKARGGGEQGPSTLRSEMTVGQYMGIVITFMPQFMVDMCVGVGAARLTSSCRTLHACAVPPVESFGVRLRRLTWFGFILRYLYLRPEVNS